MLAKKNYLATILTLLTMTTLLGGCVSSFKYPGQPVIAPGTKIQLNVSASFSADEGKIYIQNGTVISKNSKDRYQTFCTLGMNPEESLLTQKWRVSPGEFIVTKIRLYNNHVHNPVLYANTDLDFLHPGGGVNYRTELHLLSTDQPVVRDLSCTNYNPDYARRGFYPVKAEFIEALGKLIEF